MTQTSLLGKAINQFYGMLKQYLRIWMGVFCIIMLCTAQRSLAQEETLKSTVKANFGVDADVKSGVLSFTDSIAINTDDWFLGPTGRGVIDVSNQAIINRLNSGENITTTFGMSQSLNSIIDGNLWLDAVFLRDYYSHNNEKDETIFGGGDDKNFDNPTTWTIKEGSVPPKNDIIDVYGHLRQDVNSALWLFGAVSTRTQNGDNYIDFEYFRNTISYSVSQGFSSLGSECGHTAYKFNTENGEVEVDGDIILSVNYINGGTKADFRFYAWIDSNELKKLSGDTLSLTDEDYKAYNNLPNKRFEFGDGAGGFEFYNCDNDSNNSYGYVRISLINTNESIFAQDNTINSVETPSWGTIATDGSVKYEYEKLNFLEFALNTTLLGLDGAITNDACSKPLGTVIVKTRTSASFTSELKDLAGPFTLGANPQNTITISKPEMLTCSVTEITLTALTSAHDVSYYEWFKDGLPFDDGTPGNTLTITQPGIYSVKANFYEGCEIKSNEVEVIQNSIEPNVSALGGVIVCSIGQIQLNGTISSTNPNANLTFEWTGPNNFVNSTELSPFVSLEGIYTLTVTDIDNGCISFASAEVTSESITPLEIQCPPTINVQCRDDVPGPDISTVIIISGGNPTVQFVGDVSDNGTCPETITRTYSATDGCGNVAYCSQTITVNDTIGPEIVDVADYQLEGCAAEWPEFLTTTWSDNCSTGGSINSDAGVDKGSSGDGSIEYREYTFTVKDGCDNTATETTLVSKLMDVTPLDIQCPQAINVQCREDVPGPDISTVIIISGVNPTVQFVGDVSDNGTCPETITRTYSATDGCGNIVYCTQIITVNDTIDPEIVDVADYQLEGCAAEWPEFLTTTWSDNCTESGSINSDTGVDKGSSTDGSIEYREYTFTVSDNCGNSDTETTLVSRVIGSAPLEIQCPPTINVQCREDVPGPDISTVIIVNGENPTVQFEGDVSDNGTCPETITRTYSATDGCGNIVYCTQIITVNDTIDPEIVDVADHQLEGCAAEWPGFLTTTWSDNCSTGGSINSDVGVDKGSSADGSIEYREYTFTVKDGCDNTATETTLVSKLIDATPLDIQCPQAIEVQCRDDVPGPDISTVIIISGGNPTVQFVGDVSDNGTCPETITRTYSATDACGNVAYCTQIITVNDTIDPEIVDVADYQLEGCAAEWPGFLTSTWTDNCSTGGNIDSDAGVDKGSSTDGTIEYREYTFTVSDDCGNLDTETTLVSKLIDVTPLDIQCPQAINVQCREDVPGPDISTVIIISGGNPTVQFVGDVSDNGTCPETITRTYSATDACGNVVYCTQIITVNDTIDPEIVDVADYRLEGCAAEWPEFLTTTWSDNCSTGGSINSDVGVDKGSSADGSIEYREYIFTVKDGCDNTAIETTLVSRLIGNGETIQGNDIELILGYGEFDLYELLPEGYIPGGIWMLYSTNPDGLNIEISNSGSIFISDELHVGNYVFHYTVDCTVIAVTVYLIAPSPPPCDDAEKIIGNDIELCRDYGEFDLNFLLPDDYKDSEGSWTLYSTDPEGLYISVPSETGLIFVYNELTPGEYVFHYKIECLIVVEVKVILLEAAPPCVLACKDGEISTAVTPNGDNVNETFDTGLFPDESCTVDVQIFNRWGAKVFEAQNYQNDWSGTVNSKAIGSAGKITTGTYYYILKYKTNGEVEQTVTGYFYVATE